MVIRWWYCVCTFEVPVEAVKAVWNAIPCDFALIPTRDSGVHFGWCKIRSRVLCSPSPNRNHVGSFEAERFQGANDTSDAVKVWQWLNRIWNHSGHSFTIDKVKWKPHKDINTGLYSVNNFFWLTSGSITNYQGAFWEISACGHLTQSESRYHL